MYCKQCGTKNAAGSLYCQEDGVELEASVKETKTPILSAQKVANCTTCIHPVISDALYCTHCGMATEKVESVSTQSQPVNTPSAAPVQQSSKPISYVKLAIYPVVVLIILSIISGILLNVLNQTLADGFFEMGDLGVNILSFVDVLLLMHFVSMELSVNAWFLNADVVLSGGLILLLVIPAILLMIVGFSLGKGTRSTSTKEVAAIILVPSFIYTSLLSIINLFASRTFEIADRDYDLISITASYAFFSTFTHALVISALFITIGFSISSTFLHFSFLAAFKRAALHSAIIFFLLMGMTGFSDVTKEDFDEGVTFAAFTTQLTTYFWHVSHLLTVSADINAPYEHSSITYNVFTGAKSSFSNPYQEELINETVGGFTRILFIFPILVHGLAGFLWVAKQQVPLIRSIGAYAIATGIIHAVFIWLSSFTLDSFVGSYTVGSSWILGFIVTTFITGVAVWAGCQIKQKSFT